jgi:basic membrane protein A
MRYPWRALLALIVAALALGAAACGGDDETDAGGGAAQEEQTQTESKVKNVAFFGVAPTTSGNWDPPGFQAFTTMSQKYGFKASNLESIGYDQAVPVIQRLARRNDAVIAHSSGYEAAMQEVAPEFPDKWFIVFSDLSSTKGLKNLAGWAVNWNELGYLAATAACQGAKSRGGDAIGHVNSEPIPAFTRYAAGAKQGAEDQGCKWMTRWISSFSDVAKAKQAALSMIADGAEAITSSADTADKGSQDAAVDRDKLFIANYFPTDAQKTKSTVTTVVIGFEPSFDEMGQLLSSGKIQAKVYDVNVANGGLTFDAFTNVEPEVEQKSKEVLEQIKSGEIKIDPEAEVKP